MHCPGNGKATDTSGRAHEIKGIIKDEREDMWQFIHMQKQ